LGSVVWPVGAGGAELVAKLLTYGKCGLIVALGVGESVLIDRRPTGEVVKAR
jgi:hypothetical protein